MPIRVLSEEVASKIAAGEVVERPVSVVKELVENSIDAGANEIRIEVRQGGRRLVRISDDGAGIPSDEVELAFARHATSKIASVEELTSIATLGFRGEALASIAAVSHLTILTRTSEEDVGTQLRLEGGNVTQRQKKGCPQGTVITVENLFYNVPARLKFLRSEVTERKHIDGLIYRYSMAYPHLRFSLLNDERPTFQSLGTGELYDVLIKVYGLELAQQMLRVQGSEVDGSGLADVYGYISSPSLHRGNRNYLTFFVNGRWVQDRMLSYAVGEAYHTLLPTGRYPIAVLCLELAPSQVDINVHPTKSEIRFLDSSAVFATVQKAVRRSLVDQARIPRMTGLPSQGLALDMERRRRLVQAGTQTELSWEAQRTAGIKAPTTFEFPEPSRLPPLRVVGQIAQTYIIAEGPEGLYLIDQHTAHERVLYERLMAERAKMDVASQVLLEPLTLELPFQTGVASGGESLEVLNQLGFDIEPFGGNTYLVRAVPTMLAGGDINQTIVELVDGLTEDGAAGTGEETALISLVCHSAVRAGHTLSLDEMRDLIRQLEETSMPRTCPHGRPTMIHLSATQLAREFGRV